MIDCKHLEWADTTPWHGDVFDHPSYKSICQLRKKEVHSFLTCNRCPHYDPDYQRLSDGDLLCELRLVTELLEADDRMQPMSAYVAAKLSYQRNYLLQEVKNRRLKI